MKQLELFPDLYEQPWICEICEEDTSKVEYDYIGSGYNHLGCELKHEEEQKELDKVKHFADGFHDGEWERD